MLDRLGQAALAVLLLIVVFSGASAWSAEAEGPDASKVLADPYSVTGVTIDVSASNAAEARDKAIVQAQRKAFGELFKRVVSDGANRVAPDVSEFDLQRMIQGFEIEQERSSAVRYVASMGFKFRQKAVTSYINSLGLRVNDSLTPGGVAVSAGLAAATALPAPMSTAKPTLVLPVAQGTETAVLWEERTPWRSAWEDLASATGNGKLLMVPGGELTDIADIGTKDALVGDGSSLVKIAGHYDAGMVAVVVLAAADRLDPAVGAQVLLNRYGPNGAPLGPAETVAISGTLGEGMSDFLARAASVVGDRLASLPVPPVVPGGSGVPVLARVPINSMSDWLEVRRRLTSDPMVSSVDTVAMTRTKIDVAIHYRGQVEGLRAMLDRDGLTLVPAPGGWSLYIKAAVAPPPPRVSVPTPRTAAVEVQPATAKPPEPPAAAEQPTDTPKQ